MDSISTSYDGSTSYTDPLVEIEAVRAVEVGRVHLSTEIDILLPKIS